MITLINNMNMNDEEKSWFENIYCLFHPEPIIWIDLEHIKSNISKYLNNFDASVVVATGGIEIYEPKDNEKIFVFQSPYHKLLSASSFNELLERGSKLTRDILERPENYHSSELQRLENFLKQLIRPSKIKIVEGDAGTEGLSFIRLACIYNLVKHYGHDPEILVGVASNYVQPMASTRETVSETYLRDFTSGKTKRKIIFQCSSNLLRATEFFGEKKELKGKNELSFATLDVYLSSAEGFKKTLEKLRMPKGDALKYLFCFESLLEKRDERIKIDAGLIASYNQMPV